MLNTDFIIRFFRNFNTNEKRIIIASCVSAAVNGMSSFRQTDYTNCFHNYWHIITIRERRDDE